jgi:acetylornithine deacetylase/succinyl-diaminopimelate desuccinylase-like protein
LCAIGLCFFHLILPAGCAPPERRPQPLAAELPLGERAALLLAEAIRMRTVNPPGDEAPLAAHLADRLHEAGLEARVVPTPAGDSSVGRAAAWGRLRGSGRARPLVLLSHLDVVPATSSAWRHDPFAGARIAGHVVGRGALDAKGVAVVQLLAMTELARRGRPLDRDVIFLATPDEETGGTRGAGWLVRERPELLGGAEYLLTEGGGVQLDPEGGPEAWHVGVTEKSPCWLRLVAHGRAGHASVPRPDAAVPRLVAALERIRLFESPVRVVPEVARMFRALAPLADHDDRAGFEDLERGLADPAFRERFLARDAYAALVRDTATITVLQGSPRTNVVPGEASAHVDARLLPGGSCESFSGKITALVDDPGIRVDALLAFASRSSRVDTALFRAIESVARAGDPQAVVIPRVTAGFTDAHWFREVGITAYGFVPRWDRAGESRGIHGAGERISIENLERGVHTLVEILERLDEAG